MGTLSLSFGSFGYDSWSMSRHRFAPGAPGESNYCLLCSETEAAHLSWSEAWSRSRAEERAALIGAIVGGPIELLGLPPKSGEDWLYEIGGGLIGGAIIGYLVGGLGSIVVTLWQRLTASDRAVSTRK